MVNGMREVSLKLPENTLRKLQLLARDEDVTVGQIVRDAIISELRRRNVPPPPDPGANTGRVLISLRDELQQATGWHDLARRLRGYGCFVTEEAGVLVVKRLQDQTLLCRAEDLGSSYAALLERFRAPIPGPRPVPAEERVFASVQAPDPALHHSDSRS